jgi:hypothetical protein
VPADGGERRVDQLRTPGAAVLVPPGVPTVAPVRHHFSESLSEFHETDGT